MVQSGNFQRTCVLSEVVMLEMLLCVLPTFSQSQQLLTGAVATTTTPRQRVSSTSAAALELQQDCGRGQEHLSARLEQGDVCVYQVGSWMVDWVEVGPGELPRLLLARTDIVQINWTMCAKTLPFKPGRSDSCRIPGVRGLLISDAVTASMGESSPPKSAPLTAPQSLSTRMWSMRE
jgi:hypothetical protein